jgi:methionyl-tRNA synthetase
VSPFMPQRAQDVWAQLGGPASVHDQRFDSVSSIDPTGWKVTKGAPLFPKEQK